MDARLREGDDQQQQHAAAAGYHPSLLTSYNGYSSPYPYNALHHHQAAAAAAYAKAVHDSRAAAVAVDYGLYAGGAGAAGGGGGSTSHHSKPTYVDYPSSAAAAAAASAASNHQLEMNRQLLLSGYYMTPGTQTAYYYNQGNGTTSALGTVVATDAASAQSSAAAAAAANYYVVQQQQQQQPISAAAYYSDRRSDDSVITSAAVPSAAVARLDDEQQQQQQHHHISQSYQAVDHHRDAYYREAEQQSSALHNTSFQSPPPSSATVMLRNEHEMQSSSKSVTSPSQHAALHNSSYQLAPVVVQGHAEYRMQSEPLQQQLQTATQQQPSVITTATTHHQYSGGASDKYEQQHYSAIALARNENASEYGMSQDIPRPVSVVKSDLIGGYASSKDTTDQHFVQDSDGQQQQSTKIHVSHFEDAATESPQKYGGHYTSVISGSFVKGEHHHGGYEAGRDVVVASKVESVPETVLPFSTPTNTKPEMTRTVIISNRANTFTSPELPARIENVALKVEGAMEPEQTCKCTLCGLVCSSDELLQIHMAAAHSHTTTISAEQTKLYNSHQQTPEMESMITPIRELEMKFEIKSESVGVKTEKESNVSPITISAVPSVPAMSETKTEQVKSNTKLEITLVKKEEIKTPIKTEPAIVKPVVNAVSVKKSVTIDSESAPDCGVCGKVFKFRISLMKHMKEAHSDVELVLSGGTKQTGDQATDGVRQLGDGVSSSDDSSGSDDSCSEEGEEEEEGDSQMGSEEEDSQSDEEGESADQGDIYDSEGDALQIRAPQNGDAQQQPEQPRIKRKYVRRVPGEVKTTPPGVHPRKQCPQCDKSLYDSSALNKHLRLVHNFKPFKCFKCDECTPTFRELKAHVEANHEGETVHRGWKINNYHKQPFPKADIAAAEGSEVKISRPEKKVKLPTEPRENKKLTPGADAEYNYDVENLDDGVQVFHCSSCSYSTQILRGMKRHITVSHKERVFDPRKRPAVGECEEGEGGPTPKRKQSLGDMNEFFERQKKVAASHPNASLFNPNLTISSRFVKPTQARTPPKSTPAKSVNSDDYDSDEENQTNHSTEMLSMEVDCDDDDDDDDDDEQPSSSYVKEKLSANKYKSSHFGYGAAAAQGSLGASFGYKMKPIPYQALLNNDSARAAAAFAANDDGGGGMEVACDPSFLLDETASSDDYMQSDSTEMMQDFYGVGAAVIGKQSHSISNANLEREKNRQLNVLIKSMGQDESGRIICTFCSKTFINKYILKSHVNAIHLKIKSYNCPRCNFSSVYKNKLKGHIIEVHAGDTVNAVHVNSDLQCRYCSKVLCNKNYLNVHISKIHAAELEKDGAGGSASNKSDTESQQNKANESNSDDGGGSGGGGGNTNHSNEAKELNNESSSQSADEKVNDERTTNERSGCSEINSLSADANSKRDSKQFGDMSLEFGADLIPGADPFPCDQCDKVFPRVDYLRRHVETVHLLMRPHKCPYDACTYAARTRDHLEQHIYTHTGEKPFECHVCSYRCTQSGALKGHIMRRHSDEKQHVCPVPGCGHSAAVRGDMTRHIREHGPAFANFSFPYSRGGRGSRGKYGPRGGGRGGMGFGGNRALAMGAQQMTPERQQVRFDDCANGGGDDGDSDGDFSANHFLQVDYSEGDAANASRDDGDSGEGLSDANYQALELLRNMSKRQAEGNDGDVDDLQLDSQFDDIPTNEDDDDDDMDFDSSLIMPQVSLEIGDNHFDQ